MDIRGIIILIIIYSMLAAIYLMSYYNGVEKTRAEAVKIGVARRVNIHRGDKKFEWITNNVSERLSE